MTPGTSCDPLVENYHPSTSFLSFKDRANLWLSVGYIHFSTSQGLTYTVPRRLQTTLVLHGFVFLLTLALAAQQNLSGETVQELSGTDLTELTPRMPHGVTHEVTHE